MVSQAKRSYFGVLVLCLEIEDGNAAKSSLISSEELFGDGANPVEIKKNN